MKTSRFDNKEPQKMTRKIPETNVFVDGSEIRTASVDMVVNPIICRVFIHVRWCHKKLHPQVLRISPRRRRIWA